MVPATTPLRLAPSPSCSRPLLTVVVPENVLVADRIKLPVWSLVRPPVPLMTPEMRTTFVSAFPAPMSGVTLLRLHGPLKVSPAGVPTMLTWGALVIEGENDHALVILKLP